MSSKFSLSEKRSRKLENSIEERQKAAQGIDARDDITLEESQQVSASAFEFEIYDDAGAERSGYANYSYWRSTVRMFSKNKLAMAMLVIMLFLVLFTFIQPLLPDQYDPNAVNYYDPAAAWITVDEDAKMTVSGIKLTRGEYPAGAGAGEILTFINVPAAWGVPAVTVQPKGAAEEDAIPLAVTADSANAGWYYVVMTKDMPHMVIRSADGKMTTYMKATWITVDEATLGVTSVAIKQTEGKLASGGAEGAMLVYVSAPAGWGTPKLKAAKTMMGTDAVEVALLPDPENGGWYYGFVPEELTLFDVSSEDGSAKGKNKGVALASEPTEIKTLSGFIKNQKPSAHYWFGTNDIGQDLWARMWSGTRTSLLIGIIVAAINAAAGITMGLLWGYVRKLDFLFTEIYNLINNIPSTIILMLVSFIMRPSMQTIIIAMCITGWIGLARFIRNQVLIIRDRDFNLASRCLGTPTRRIIMKNLLPQMVSVVMLRMALSIPDAIGSEVFLSYIGLGLPIDVPSLGNLINKGRSMMMAPSLRYQLWIPAIILSIITICFYLVGNAFADAADPKNHV